MYLACSLKGKEKSHQSQLNFGNYLMSDVIHVSALVLLLSILYIVSQWECRLNFSRYLLFRYKDGKGMRPNGITWKAYIKLCLCFPSRTHFTVHKSLYTIYTIQKLNYILSICLKSNSLSFKLFQARSISSLVGGFFFCFDAVIFL